MHNPAIIEDILNQAIQTPGRISYPRQIILSLIVNFSAVVVGEKLSVVPHGAQRGPHVVGDAVRECLQFPDRLLEPGRSVGNRLFERLLQQFPFGDVHNDNDDIGVGRVYPWFVKDLIVAVVCGFSMPGPVGLVPETFACKHPLESLLELSRDGRHAASDHLETAALAGVVTIGCRRAGGGLAGAVTDSNVAEGARLAADRDPDLVIFDGSGAAIPPVAVDRRILVVGPGQDATAYLNAYRVLISDLVVVLGDGDLDPIRALKDVPVIRIDLRLRPIEPLGGRRVAVFTAGPAETGHLDAEVVAASTNLANRGHLRQDLARVDAEVYLVELKAAAIDVVAEAAAARGVELVLAANDVVSPELDAELERLTPVGVRT